MYKFLLIVLVLTLASGERAMANCNTSKIWQKIELALHEKYPAIVSNFNPPVTRAQIEVIESEIGVKLPDSVVSLYESRNGEGKLSYGVFGGWIWLSIEDVKKQYIELLDLQRSYPSKGYDELTSIPIFYYQGEILYVESANEEDSPIYLRNHENPQKVKLAPSVCGFLGEYLQKINGDDWVYTTHKGKYVDLRPRDRELWPWQ